MKPTRLPRPLVAANLAGFYGLTFHHRMPLRLQRRLLDAAASGQALPAGTVVHRIGLAGRPAERITVGATERPRALLYLHGGGYTLGSLTTHRSLAAFLARESGSVVFSLDYRLAPEHPYPAALEDSVAAFAEIIARHGFPAHRVAISGDSAGGGLAAAAARRSIDENGLRPGALALLSPWTDPSDEEGLRPRDLVVNTRWGRRNAAAYLAAGDPADPGYAPLRADLTGLPPTLVHAGRRELLYPQILRFAAALRAAGVETTLVEHPTLWHSGHALAGLLREAADAVHQVGVFLRTRLDAPVRAAARRQAAG